MYGMLHPISFQKPVGFLVDHRIDPSFAAIIQFNEGRV